MSNDWVGSSQKVRFSQQFLMKMKISFPYIKVSDNLIFGEDIRTDQILLGNKSIFLNSLYSLHGA